MGAFLKEQLRGVRKRVLVVNGVAIIIIIESAPILLCFLLGAIDTVTVSIVNSSDFMGDPPTFTLIADISGGPPVTYTWGRNSNTLITKSRGPYDFSLEVNGVNTLDVESVSPVLQESRYRSTLTVTGNLPGRYGFHVINRAMMNYKRDSIYIRGISLIQLVLVYTKL